MVKKEDICKAVKGYAKKFFEGQLGLEATHTILTHIIFCDECLSYYTEFAKTKNIDYTITDAVVDLTNLENEIRHNDNTSDISDDKENLEKEFTNDKWTQAAIGWNIDRLIYLQVFRELNTTHDLQRDKGNIDYIPFYKYIIRKAAQKVDMLERCLKKEVKAECR